MEKLKQNKFLYPIILLFLLSMGHNGYVIIELITGKKIDEPKTYWMGKYECTNALKSEVGELQAYKAIFGKIESGTLQFMYESAKQQKKETNISWRQ